jgi:iron complex transport system substrate-binding protein
MSKGMKVIYFCVFLWLGYATAFIQAEESYPQRIISLGTSLTEELYLLGVEDRIVGTTIYCDRPPQAKAKEKVGTVTEVDLEKIVGLKPDLVLATSLTNLQAVEKFKRLGLKVLIFPQPRSFSSLCEDFLKLGRAVGKEKEAVEIVDQAKRRVRLIEDKVKALARPKVFVQIGARPLYTVTRDSFINDFVELAGGINIAAGAKSGLYSREKVLKDNPEVVIIATMGLVGEEEKKMWQKFKTLNAVKNNRINIIDSYTLCSPTPVSFTETLEEMVKIIHQ